MPSIHSVFEADGRDAKSDQSLGHAAQADSAALKLQAEVKNFISSADLKKTRRDIDKFVTLNVQQISGTRQQVMLAHFRLALVMHTLAARHFLPVSHAMTARRKTL